MSKKSKIIPIVYLLFLIIILISMGGILSIAGKFTTQNNTEQNSVISTQPIQPRKLPHPLKQALIEDIEKEGERKYKTYTLFEGDTEKFIEPYREDHFAPGYTPTPPEKVEDYGLGGILVMEKTDSGPKLLWNSVFEMREVPNRIKVRDINNDGIKEILSYWDYLSRYFYKDLWVFQYNKDSHRFRLITPLERGGEFIPLEEFDKKVLGYREITNFYPLFHGQKVELKDLDNDQIDEVKVVEIDDYRQDSPNEAEYPHMKNTKIYKWNGKEFYLWQDKTSKNTGADEW